ncbi:hypothetical protein [Haloarcula argentinensis]|uniref:Uncharacterized protein n=1 Tax=Haloarcula argentinensis TaxID=43776 RepID=A0ABU2F2B2_HALAR|nr:hypothetical protein [Haloarcula argentinensis]MDS0254707.1 hypothetical protein [Haloarcula argentinensis]
MVTSCAVYNITRDIDIDDVYSRFTSGGASYNRPPSHVDDPLLTDVSNVQRTSEGIECTVRYDIEDTVPVREGEDPWIDTLKTTTVRISENNFILNKFDSKTKAAREVGRVLEIGTDGYDPVEFSSATILGVVAEDSEGTNQETWKNPTEHADTATLYGDISDSALAADFDTDGRPSWVRFESSQYPQREVGISSNKDSVVFVGDWDFPEMESYISNVVIPNNS